MKVAYTKQSNVDMYDFDFLTEANPRHTNNRYGNAGSNSRDYSKSSKSSKSSETPRKKGGSKSSKSSKSSETPRKKGGSKSSKSSKSSETPRNMGDSKSDKSHYDFPNTRYQNKRIFKSNRKPIADKKRSSNPNSSVVVSSNTTNNTTKDKKRSSDPNSEFVVSSNTTNNTTKDKKRSSDPNSSVVVSSNTASNTTKDKKSAESANKLINMMNRLGNSISEMFKWIWDQIKKIPRLMGRIGGYLKNLWGKIKGWCTRFHIVDRTKTLSRLAIACIGFVSSLILICINGIPGVEPEDSHIPYYIDRLKHPEKYIHNPETAGAAETPQEEKKEKNETAVFIETLDMILREDSNGGVFMAIARKAIEKGKKIANAVCIAYRNSENIRLKNLVGTLRTFVYGSSAALKGSNGELIAAGTRFDNSLPALYESIIREAQNQKIKEIKKKAIKKVKLKRSLKRSLKGWV